MSKPKILLVENSNIALQIQKRILKDLGATLVTASDGDEALRIARKVMPDLIYLSLNLPGMDGAACCRTIKSDPALMNIPVAMVCSPSGAEPGLCKAAGCDAIVAKPVDRRQFLEVGQSLLSLSAGDEDRIPCRATVACTAGEETFYGTIEDVSVSGMLIGAPRLLSAGDLLVVKFILPWSGASLIEAEAEVTWVNGGKRRRRTDLSAALWVAFRHLEPDSVEQIQDFIELSRLRLPWR